MLFQFQGGSSAARPLEIILDETANYSTTVHEIGHILGFKHPYGAVGGSSFPSNIEYRNRHDLSVMNVWDTALRRMTKNDTDALQWLYGAPGSDFDGLQARLMEEGITPEIL